MLHFWFLVKFQFFSLIFFFVLINWCYCCLFSFLFASFQFCFCNFLLVNPPIFAPLIENGKLCRQENTSVASAREGGGRALAVAVDGRTFRSIWQLMFGCNVGGSVDALENRARHTIYVTFCTPNLMTLSSSSPRKRKWCNAK